MAFSTQDETEVATGLLTRYSDRRIAFTDALISSMVIKAGTYVLTSDDRHFGLMGAVRYLEQAQNLRSL